MQNVKNIGEACERKENLDIAFARCLQSYDDYYQYVEDVEMKKEALDACHSIITRKKEFDEHFVEWSKSVQEIANGNSVNSQQENDAGDKTHGVTRPVVSKGSEKSTSSKSSSRASERSRKAKAELLRREVELKNLLKRQEMEHQMERQLGEMKSQEEELKHRIAVLVPEGEIEKAKVVDDLFEASESSKHSIKSELKLVNTEEASHSYPTTRHAELYTKCDPKNIGTNYLKPALDLKTRSWDPGPSHSRSSGENLAVLQQLQQMMKQQQEALQVMAVSIQQGIEMPKKEVLTFDGNPLNYWLFVNNFKVNIAKRVPDAELRLAYLIQHCSGKAREAIMNCAIISDPNAGYRKAQEILYHRFGQKHIVAHAHIAKIVEGPQLKGMDVTGLSDLPVQMQNCALTLAQMGYKADVNGSDNLIKVMKRLPVHLQSKWADRAGSLTQAGVEPNFWHLAKFVEEKALLANTMYGRAVGSIPD